MKSPEIKVLGVYRLRVTPRLFKEQFSLLYGYRMSFFRRVVAKIDCWQQLKSVVLIELLINNVDEHFSVDDFTQRQPGVSRNSWQAPYLVRYLSIDGQTPLSPATISNDEHGSFRCTFFLHFFQKKRMLLTSYGAKGLPRPLKMIERLEKLAPYEPVD